MRKKNIWFTDPHLLPWTRYKMVNTILSEDPEAVFITGDLCYGPTLAKDLEALGKTGKKIYFVLGNHDYHGSSFKDVYALLQSLHVKYPNLIWMTEAGVQELSEEVAIIGVEGWYDARIGNPEFITYTMDWILISELKSLPNMKQRINAFRNLALIDTESVVASLEKAIDKYKTIYLLTHFPPWREANLRRNILGEEFWEPYNCNIVMGQELEKVMAKHKKRNLIVLCGHTHSAMQIHVSRNIECRVGRGAYHKLSGDEIIYI